jgi:3-polyprenyl-4-hydroxybenzoate decarboxylase
MRGQHRIIVGISGATGIALGARALELLCEAGVKTHHAVTRPESREDVITHVVARALDLFGLELAIPRWNEDE